MSKMLDKTLDIDTFSNVDKVLEINFLMRYLVLVYFHKSPTI